MSCFLRFLLAVTVSETSRFDDLESFEKYFCRMLLYWNVSSLSHT